MPTPRAPRRSLNLARVRSRIDALDRRLVALLNERSEWVVKVGEYKRSAGLPVYAPHREAEVLQRALDRNTGPLPAGTLEAVYRELMSGSFTLQQALRVGFLGPEGSYSHMAALRHFGSSVSLASIADITGAVDEVARGHVDYAIVPIENTIGGGIVETLDALRDIILHGARREVSICAEVQLAVRHALLCNGRAADIQRIYSKPEVLTQCREWLARTFPGVDQVHTPSSSRAVEMVSRETAVCVKRRRRVTAAAIGSELAGRLYGLHALFMRIEDRPGNVTRFIVLARQRVPRTGDDKTSLMFDLADRPGALVGVLKAFADQRINLTHIEKRPSGRRNWTYTFFLDCLGHRDEARIQKALLRAGAHCKDLMVLGSFPRSHRAL
ncbi:MAG: prephenate dehydratase [Phycisphaerales bacterium]